MKILQISFKNLNSLVGLWCIDLTHPEYVSDGIFAITGPTGAGKTTILDAICLALYGATPRLGKIGKGGNELMSRQRGECHAQVTFETSSGRYVSHWAQRRAHKKPNGELQGPRHEVSRARTGEILASSVKESGALILELTGMSFDQFSRSMMLAQGAFAAFLQAKSDERAPILEQITGSEIYSQISIMVHEQRGQHRARLDALETQLQGTRLLDEDNHRELVEQLKQSNVQAGSKYAQIQTVQQKMRALKQIESVSALLAQNQTQQLSWSERLEAFKPSQARLQAARRAIEIAPEYKALQIARESQVADQQTLHMNQQKSPHLEQAVAVAQRAVVTGETQLSQSQQRYRQLQPIIEQARRLDVQLDQFDASMATSTQALRQQSDAFQALNSQHENLTQQHNTEIDALQQLKTQAEEHVNDSILVAELSVLTDRLTMLSQQDFQINEATQQVTRLAQQQRQAFEARDGLAKKVIQIQADHEAVQQVVQEKSQQLRLLLEAQSIGGWRHTYTQLSNRKRLLEKASEIEAQYRDTDERRARDHQKHQQYQQTLSALEQTLSLKAKEIDLYKQQAELLQQQHLLHQRIETFEQARLQLHDGQPCPLCGAKEHPFTHDGIPEKDEMLVQFEQAKTKLEGLTEALTALRLELAVKRQEKERLDANLTQYAQTLVELRSRLNQTLADLEMPQACVEMPVDLALQKQLEQTAVQFEQISQKLESAQQLTDHLHLLQAELEKKRQTLDQAQLEVIDAGHKAQTAQGSHEQAQQSLQSLRTHRDTLVAQLVQKLAAHSIGQESLSDVVQVKAQLTRRRDFWVDLQNKLQVAHQTKQQRQQTLQFQQEKIAEDSKKIKDLEAHVNEIQSQRTAVLSERQKLLGTESPDLVHNTALEKIEQDRQVLERSQIQLNERQAAHHQQLQRIKDLQAGLQNRTVQIGQMSVRMKDLLLRAGFADEAAYLQTLMPENQRQTLEHQEKQLFEEQTRLEASRQDLARQLEELNASVSTDDQYPVLSEEAATLEYQYGAQMEQIGAMRQRLADDERARLEYASKLDLIQGTRRDLERWDQLHALIGSADGKKFRMFAQGLTFEIVIQHANQQLQKMTDRYVLVRSSQEPLELNVIDQYQASEERTTKNLSGGESFLVSLALALGLSKMASKNVRVDSLFLDEGFGTLDEDALDTALQTLSSLRQEGKLIGVISHIQTLKDRIGAQIQVAPVRGGRSVLSGPGCERMDEPTLITR